MKRLLVIYFLLAVFCAFCLGQQQSVLKNADILRMTKSGLSAEVVVALIKDSPCAFDTSPRELQRLKSAKVSDSVIQAMVNAPKASITPAKPEIDPGKIIREGFGWGAFTVGASHEALVNALGLPDDSSPPPLLEWRKLGINCLLDSRGEASELRFNKEFRGVTQTGISYGMPEKTVRAAYGDPKQAQKLGGGTRWDWPSRGLLIWFADGRVNQIVVYRPR
jgi:hypothetical protein